MIQQNGSRSGGTEAGSEAEGGVEAVTLDSVVAASSDQVHRKLGEEAVILGLDRGVYYGVDQVGARIWELVQDPIEVAAIRDRLLEEYEVDRDVCERDLIAFLGQLLEHGLIEVRPDRG